MNIKQGIHHKRHWVDCTVAYLQFIFFAIAAVCVVLIAVDIWITEDDARVGKLEQKIYDAVYSRVDEPVAAAPRPSPSALAEPKVRYFQDSAKRGGGTP